MIDSPFAPAYFRDVTTSVLNAAELRKLFGTPGLLDDQSYLISRNDGEKPVSLDELIERLRGLLTSDQADAMERAIEAWNGQPNSNSNARLGHMRVHLLRETEFRTTEVLSRKLPPPPPPLQSNHRDNFHHGAIYTWTFRPKASGLPKLQIQDPGIWVPLGVLVLLDAYLLYKILPFRAFCSTRVTANPIFVIERSFKSSLLGRSPRRR